MKLYPYQKKAIEFTLHRPYTGLFMEMGLGKTVVSLMTLEHLKTFGGFEPTLILAPSKVLETTWPDEIKDWNFDFSYEILIGNQKKRKKLLQNNVDIYMISYDNIDWLVKQKEFRKLKILICDEISKLKSTKSIRFRSLRKQLMRFSRRIGLTGMPVANHLIDLFGIMYIIDSGMTFPKKTEFLSQYFVDVGKRDYPIYKPLPGAEDKIYRRIAPNVLAMEADDYLDLPPYVHQDIKLKLPHKARKLYDKLERDFLAQVGDQIIDVETAATLSMKTRQLVSGFLYNDDKTIAINKERLAATKDFVESLEGEPVIIAYYFQESKDRLLKLFGKNARHIGKGVKGEELKKTLKLWNEGKLEVLLIFPQSSHGLNLQFGGHHILWYELTWSLDDYKQLLARLKRPGQKHRRIFSHRLLFKDTVDIIMRDSIKEKEDRHDRCFKAIKQYRENINYALSA